MAMKNCFYAQSGGVTAVINASACGLIETARKYPETFGHVYAGLNGILGALNENLVDTSALSDSQVASLKYTPGGAFGSCRYKLKSLEQHSSQYNRLIEVFRAHNIGYFFYNGGGDSQDTAHKVAQMGEQMGYPIRCIGIPKTVDNDLPITDNCPGFGSVAKYIAVSTAEAALDVASMAETSTKVFIMEVMGRHAGWIAASSGLAATYPGAAPHIILFPEVAFNPEKFLEKVKTQVKENGYCVIVVSEGLRHADGRFLAESGLTDAFGHKQLGGVAPVIAQMIKSHLGYKYHWAVCDYLQRAARHIASQTDVDQAYALGEAAIEFAKQGKSGIMTTIERTSDNPYCWQIGEAPLAKVANVEQALPKHYITEDGFNITEAARQYLSPLIQGEAYPPYDNGLPRYQVLPHQLVPKVLPKFDEV